MKKRSIIRIISLLSAAVIISLGFLVKEHKKNEAYLLQLENGYSHALSDFNSAINNINLTLSKAKYVTTPEQISTMAAKLLSEAQTSKTALIQLPLNGELTVLNRFLSQVGNFAMSISKKLIKGEELTEQDSKNIDLLSETADKISRAVSDTQIDYNNAEYWASELEDKLDSQVDSESLSTSLEAIEEELSDFPTLVYDGPYSDHILEKEPEMIKNAELISESDAKRIAAAAVGCEEKELKNTVLTEGKIPAYRFEGNNFAVSVSRKGGYPVFLRRDRPVADTVITYEQAITKAKRYLEQVGMSGFIPTYYYANEGVCVVNFAFVDGETICYTDLVKVGVAMDNGEIALYEASGYLTNHRERTFKTPAYSENDALKLISKKLNINSIAMSLVPTDFATEVRCYEFACAAADGQEILIYINAETLKEENILILLKSDGGTLVK